MYRNRPIKVTLLLLLVLASMWGQKKPARGPRATALVVLSPDGKSAVRLIPICIRDNDRFWDASIYQASPRPMALEPGTVYEMERTGNPIGLFVISQPAQDNGNWIALGTWQMPRARAAARPSPTSDDERPVLRRAPVSGGPAQGTPAPEAPRAEAPPPAPVTSDPDRPMLKRGKPAAGSEPVPTPMPPAGAAAPKTAAGAPKVKPLEMVPAISDADGPDPRPFVFSRNADEEARLSKAVSGLAEAAVVKQAGLAPGAARADVKDVSVKFFDLDGNNGAEVVFTAHLALVPQVATHAAQRERSRRPAPRPPSVALREFYVTFIAREDLNGELHSSYSRITDARNVDLDGRFELIDAVDVDGDGRGELLLRRLIGKDITYVVLKVGLSQTTKLFDSAGEQ